MNNQTITKLFTILLILGFCLSRCDLSRADQGQCSLIPQFMTAASQIRGLASKSNVPCILQNKQEVKAYLLKAIETKVPNKKLENEEFVYKVLGFIPEDMDYRQTLVKMYTDQLGGYYDPEAKRFAMAAWMPAGLQGTIAVHELTHALQDQHYDLHTFMDLQADNSDKLLARSALVEGDATAVMMDYTRDLVGAGRLQNDADVDGLMMQNILGMSMLAGTQAAPQGLLMQMSFPYISGLRFVHSQLRKVGYSALDKVFKNPPNSTEEILHPEKYNSEIASFVEVPIPANPFDSSKETKLVHEDTYGEFFISILLGSILKDQELAGRAAAGWGGDRIALYENDLTKCRALIWETNWDTIKDAQEFLSAFNTSLAQRHKLLSSVLRVQLEGVRVSFSENRCQS